MGGDSSQLNDFYLTAPDGSSATFTYKLYNLTNTTDPYFTADEATDIFYQDICATSDFYLALTFVTGGTVNMEAYY